MIVDLPMASPVGDDGNEEHAGGDWFTRDEINALDLHPGFAATADTTLHTP